ncbi:hypothetical protein SCFA_750002 [anaerobic digester metagenome]|uniref:Uncharacterized protein n=1 Tax=anaerobic digester metagenome TaxID=1263854 RepID=A0A485M733_9ZZZZ|nr:hypothetical protein [Bacillota bacterium]
MSRAVTIIRYPSPVTVADFSQDAAGVKEILTMARLNGNIFECLDFRRF